MTGQATDQGSTHRSCWDRKPVPEGFSETFIRFGWRGIETFYGARTSVNRRWIDEAGGPSLMEARRRYRDALRAVRATRGASSACPA
jgi:hypothetical protein